MSDLSERFERCQREGGADFDPLRFNFIAAMMSRIEPRGLHSATIESKAAAALQQYLCDWQHARQQQPDQTDASVSTSATKSRAVAELSALTALLDNMASVIPDDDSLSAQMRNQDSALFKAGDEVLAAGGAQLRAAKLFQQSWRGHSAAHRIDRAIASAPQDAGPLNPQKLVIRALSQLQKVSPAYLERFLASVDSELWLQQAVAKATPDKATKKRAAKSKK